MERDPIAADRIDLPDDLDSDALAGFLETHTEYRLWSDADGEPLLVELGERDEDSDEDEYPTRRGVAQRLATAIKPADVGIGIDERPRRGPRRGPRQNDDLFGGEVCDDAE